MDLVEALAQDHRRLLGLLQAAEAQQVDRGRRLLMGRFLRGLHRHLQLEEGVLFPALERRLGDGIRPQLTAFAREHDLLSWMVADVERALASAAPIQQVPDLRFTLDVHQDAEERRVYRVAPRFLAEALPCDPSLLIDLGAPA